jgi:Holliday junction resolvasome RuvABC ATP-dependent DNA helicase subunit
MMKDLGEVKQKVNADFEGFIGNEEAIYAVKRSLIFALANSEDGDMPMMAKTFLLSGSPSVGKTELARRITAALGVPFVRLDGRALRTRERLFEMIDDSLAAQKPALYAEHVGEQNGVRLLAYPPFAVFIDEIHLVPERTQETLLTLLEADDRTMLLDGERGRRIAVAQHATFIFATTKPADLDRAFRSRCIEIQLRRYSIDEVNLMVRRRFDQLPDSATLTIASCSRLLPRIAFMMAQEVKEEIMTSDDGDSRACVRRVMRGRGIRYANGVTADDVRYLELLKREARPIGERAIRAHLYDVDPQIITDDIEPFLLHLELIAVTDKGRQITSAGKTFLRDAKAIQP